MPKKEMKKKKNIYHSIQIENQRILTIFTITI